jgi:hypothetical protein
MELSTIEKNVLRRKLRTQKNKLEKGILRYLEQESFEKIFVKKDPKGINDKIYFQFTEDNKLYWFCLHFYVEYGVLFKYQNGFVIDIDDITCRSSFSFSDENEKLRRLDAFIDVGWEKIAFQ